MGIIERFLPNNLNRDLFTGFAAFCVAGIGVALAFASSVMSFPWLGPLAFLITTFGVLGVFVFIIRSWWRFFRGDQRRPNNPNDL